MNCGNSRHAASISETIQPDIFGEEPVPRNTIAVATTLYIESVRVLGDDSVRGTHGVVSVAVCAASTVVLRGIGHGRHHDTWERTVGDDQPARVSPSRATPLQNFEWTALTPDERY
jgi:hypothetical protein